MRRAIALAIVIAASLSASPRAQLQSCGQGIAIRADGSIVIDAWLSYEVPNPPTPGPPLPGSPTRVMPKRILLGSTITDDVQVCFETAMGSTCIPVKTLKTLK